MWVAPAVGLEQGVGVAHHRGYPSDDDNEVNVVVLVAGLLLVLAAVTLSGVDEIKICIVLGQGVDRLEGNGEFTIEVDVVLGHQVFSKCANLRQGSVDRQD